jgi:hypothetical protein
MLNFIIMVEILEINQVTGAVEIDVDIIEVAASSVKCIKQVLRDEFDINSDEVKRAHNLLDVIGSCAEND